jgi:hypothetical protein
MTAIQDVLDIVEPVIESSFQLASLTDLQMKADMAVLMHRQKQQEQEEQNNNNNVDDQNAPNN